MSIIGGYHEASDQNFNILEGKKCRGMNYPCPGDLCVLTFSTESLLKQHLTEGEHMMKGGIAVQSTSDRVKESWVSGLSGNVGVRKSGIALYYEKFQGS